MRIELTEQQQLALDQPEDHPLRVVDPRTNTAYVLLNEREFEHLQGLMEDEQHRQSIQKVALRNAVGRMDDDE